MKWSVDSWKNFEAKQMPTYSDKVKLDEVLNNLSSLPPLIFAGETRSTDCSQLFPPKLVESGHSRDFLCMLLGGYFCLWLIKTHS